MASTGGRYTVVTKGPLTGAIACSNSGGYWGAELKMAGWDMVIFEGVSPKPVYLPSRTTRPNCATPAHLWGQSVWKTEEAIKTAHQDPQLRVSSIGLAGENQVLYAAVVNDLHRAAGRSGVGAVMGSKNLKAVAVRGTKGVGNLHDPKAFMQRHDGEEEDPARQRRHRPGPAHLRHPGADERDQRDRRPAHAQPPRRGQFEGAKDISAEAMATPRKSDGKAQLVTNQACFGCTIACGRISKIDKTHFSVQNKPQYWGATGGLEYEAAWALGAANGVNDLEALQYANLHLQRAGHGPDLLRRHHRRRDGAVRHGRADRSATGHRREVRLGRRRCAHFADMTAAGVGFGKEIGQGSKRLCKPSTATPN
jgi:aldehyde:ferredoxin oxidoreductase